MDEEYLGPGLDPTMWVVNDPTSAVSVVAQTLQVAGGTGADGQTTVSFIEQIELGGALELQHGDVSFYGRVEWSVGRIVCGGNFGDGMPGGISDHAVGDRVDHSGADQWSADGIGNGDHAGTPVFFYDLCVFDGSLSIGETYHSSLHPAGSGWGGAAVTADVRFVLEVQDIDPTIPRL